MTPGESQTNAPPQPTSPPPSNNHEQPSPPNAANISHGGTMARLTQNSGRLLDQLPPSKLGPRSPRHSYTTTLLLSGTPSSDRLWPKDKPHSATPTTIKKDLCHPATRIGIKAGPPEDLHPPPPASHTNKRPKP
ncbi:hypothetical protein E4T56_gene13463 [Termitomyces sp. T112]|nr:hypothetical protein E4T56_gene13463 [Termitomyces sp. T112]